MPEFATLEYENLNSVVYAALCDALMQGRFQPGDRLKIRDLAEQFGTSVTPIRDAVLRLANDEAITFRSPRDIRIAGLTEARYREIRSIRVRLEGLAAETAAQVATSADVLALEEILRQNEQAIADGDRLKGTQLNQAFHFHAAADCRAIGADNDLAAVVAADGPAYFGCLSCRRPGDDRPSLSGGRGAEAS